MKKLMAILLSVLIGNVFMSIPIHAQQSIENAYLEELNKAVSKYGHFRQNDLGESLGVGYVQLIDFNNDGTDELLYCIGEEYKENGRRIYDCSYYIYTYKNNKVQLLSKGSMEAHGGEANWEIGLWKNRSNSIRLSTTRYDGTACNSKYISFYEYDGASWNEYKDNFAAVAVEIAPGMYDHTEYYVHGEEVSKAEYENRLGALSRYGLTYINSVDFSSSYLEDVLAQLNYNSSEIPLTDWETGKYNEIMTIGDIIYYYGLYYHEDGSVDSRYTICTYNKRTGEDKPLTYQGYSLNRIGNKLWFLTGTSSGSWDRNLWCCDLDGQNIKFITNGFDLNVAFDIEIKNPFVVFNNRLYIGHNIDMEHFEVISCDLEGNDIRIETPSIYSTRWDCKLYEHYAVINDKVYPYQYSSEKVTVKLNNNEISFDQPPIIYNDRTLVPMRAIFEAMGCEVVWNDGVINVYKDDENIMTLWENVREMWLPSGSVTLDVAPMVINDRTLVPVRAITESMGAMVEWDGDLKIVYISYSENQKATEIIPSEAEVPSYLMV